MILFIVVIYRHLPLPGSQPRLCLCVGRVPVGTYCVPSFRLTTTFSRCDNAPKCFFCSSFGPGGGVFTCLLFLPEPTLNLRDLTWKMCVEITKSNMCDTEGK